MFCQNCGSEVRDGEIFCSRCGARQGAAGNSEAAAQKPKRKKGKGGLIAIAIVAVLAIGTGAGAYLYFTSDGYASRKSMQLAEECFEEEEYEDALDHYKEALKLDSSLTDAYVKCADILLLDEKYEEALEMLEKGLKKTKDDKKAQDSIAEKIEEANKLAWEKGIAGTWSLDYDLANLLAGEMGDEFADFHSPLNMTICFEFRDDNTFTMYGEPESFKVNYNAWLDEFLVYATELMYTEFSKQGLDKESADAAFLEAYSTSIDDYLRQTFENEVDVDSLLDEMTTDGIYEVSDDKLYMAEDGAAIDRNSYDVFTIQDDTLKLELPTGADPSSEDILPGLQYPLELQRVKSTL